MANYGYEAIDKTGKTVKGSVQADDQDKARVDLRAQGLTVLTLTEQSALNKDINLSIKKKLCLYGRNGIKHLIASQHMNTEFHSLISKHRLKKGFLLNLQLSGQP